MVAWNSDDKDLAQNQAEALVVARLSDGKLRLRVRLVEALSEIRGNAVTCARVDGHQDIKDRTTQELQARGEACVSHFESHRVHIKRRRVIAGFLFDAHKHRHLAFVRVLDGIAQQVREHLADAVAIRDEGARAGI
jgi:hypothetical protein